MSDDVDFSGIWVAIVTPFQPAQAGHQAVDHAALAQLVHHLHAQGVTGLVALGSTGEAAALSDAEQDAVLHTVLEAAQGLPVIAGLAGNHQGHILARLAAFNGLPLAGLLCPAPYYVRPSQAALVDYFTTVADQAVHPVILYDIPYRTGVSLHLDTLRTVARHPRVHALKDCGGDWGKTQALIADGHLQVLAGEDDHLFQTLCLGGHGAITAAAQVHPEPMVALYRAMHAGRWLEARAWHQRLLPCIDALFAEPNPAVVKGALAWQHAWLRAEVRAPMCAASAEAVGQWQQAARALALFGDDVDRARAGSS
jgi:4-hydroxy-tetrahydrodipicolinate synthase